VLSLGVVVGRGGLGPRVLIAHDIERVRRARRHREAIPQLLQAAADVVERRHRGT
jgi:hypothetical protein